MSLSAADASDAGSIELLCRLSIGATFDVEGVVAFGVGVVADAPFSPDGGGREEGRLADGALSVLAQPTAAPSITSPIPSRRIRAGRRRSPCAIGRVPLPHGRSPFRRAGRRSRP
jgi:hypothetical protein